MGEALDMKDWTPRLNRLIRIGERGRPLTQAQEDFVGQACNDSADWGCCSVAQRMLKIEDSWDRLDEQDHNYVLHSNLDLYSLGVQFAEAVQCGRYTIAKNIHFQIQHYKMDELNMALRIRSNITH